VGRDAAALIVNTGARSGAQQLRNAARLLRERGVPLMAVHGIDDPRKLSEAVTEAIQSGASLVIIGGGDGSLLATVGLLAGTDVALGVLPLGTANSFARALGLPLDLDGAVEVIATGEKRRIDLGRIGDRLYAGCASIGLAPEIAQTVPHGLKAWAGRPGYLLWAAVQFARFKPFRLIVDDGKRAETLDAVEVRIANGPYHGGVELVEEARLDSGRVVVQAVIGEKRRHLLFNWCAHLLGLKARLRSTREFAGTAFQIRTEPPLPISIDGEVLARTPIPAGVEAHAMLVIAPRRQESEEPDLAEAPRPAQISAAARLM
jgi:YegS/Rv2252/BmrU family lipid kinase